MTEPQSENQRLRGRKGLDPKRCWLCNDLFNPRGKDHDTCHDCVLALKEFRIRSQQNPRPLIIWGLRQLARRIAALERALDEFKEAKHD